MVSEKELRMTDGKKQDQRSPWEVDYRAASDVEVRAARAMAEFENYDGCFDRIARWDALEQWERDAHPGEFPESDFEDAVWWIVRWRAGIGAVRAEVDAEGAEKASPEYVVIYPHAEKRHKEAPLVPGALLRGRTRGRVVYEVIEVRERNYHPQARLRDTRTGRSAGWEYLDYFSIVAPASPAVEGAESDA